MLHQIFKALSAFNFFSECSPFLAAKKEALAGWEAARLFLLKRSRPSLSYINPARLSALPALSAEQNQAATLLKARSALDAQKDPDALGTEVL